MVNKRVTDLVIDYDSLDHNIMRRLRNIVFLHLNDRYGKSKVDFPAFIDALDEGLREELYTEVLSYYSFLGNTKLLLPDEVLYNLM